MPIPAMFAEAPIGVQLTDTTVTTVTTHAGTSSAAWHNVRRNPLYFLAIQQFRLLAGCLCRSRPYAESMAALLAARTMQLTVTTVTTVTTHAEIPLLHDGACA